MILTMIAAIGINKELGKDNKLLWHIPEDLKNFKRLTKGKPIIMGRKTFESLPGLLPGREHIVITRNSSYKKDGIEVFTDPKEAIRILESRNTPEAVVIGGAAIYEYFLSSVDTLYLSKVDWSGKADVFFPCHDNLGLKLVDSIEHEKTEKSPAWTFNVYRK